MDHFLLYVDFYGIRNTDKIHVVGLTGAGSAKPVVSNRMASNSFRRLVNWPRVRTKSPRTLQQTQPLSIVIKSSGASRDSATVESQNIKSDAKGWKHKCQDKWKEYWDFAGQRLGNLFVPRHPSCWHLPRPSSIETSPNSFSRTQIFHLFCSLRI